MTSISGMVTPPPTILGALAGLEASTTAVIGTVWTAENSVSSDANTREVALPDLFLGAQDLTTQFVHVTGTTPSLSGVFKYQPYTPQSPTVTDDRFDQVLTFYNISRVYHFLESLGFNMQAIIGSKHAGEQHPIRAFVNFMKALNAYYNSDQDHIAFGTADGKWHLASDGDVVVHELGHLILDHINPQLGIWSGGEGGSIHEAFGDALASLFFNDAEMSENFVPNVGRTPNKEDGLRIVKNDLKLSDVSSEVHDRGRVYAGFFWSIYEALEEKLHLGQEEARLLALQILINHAYHYKTNRPTPNDFTDAVVEGVKSLGRENKLPAQIQLEELVQTIEEEAKRRELRTPKATKPKKRRLPIDNTALSFKLSASSPFIGGKLIVEQQLYQTTAFGVVEVVGHGRMQMQKRGGKTKFLTTDIRTMNNGEVDESTPIPFAEALQSVREHLDQHLQVAQLRLKTLEFGFRLSEKVVYEWKEVSGNALVLQMCRTALQQKQLQMSPQYAVMEDETELSYAISLDSGIFYVNTHTGAIQFVKHIFI